MLSIWEHWTNVHEPFKNRTCLGKKLFFNFLGTDFVVPKSGTYRRILKPKINHCKLFPQKYCGVFLPLDFSNWLLDLFSYISHCCLNKAKREKKEWTRNCVPAILNVYFLADLHHIERSWFLIYFIVLNKAYKIQSCISSIQN